MPLEVFLCVKPAVRAREPIQFEADARDLATGCRLWSTSDADRYALEAALRARADGTAGTITCVTVGPTEADEVLHYCLAAGADRAVRIPAQPALLFEPATVGALLAAAIRQFAGRLVFTAQCSGDGESGIVPVYLAHALGAAYLSNVVEFACDGRVVEVQRKVERGCRQIWRSRPPAIIAFDHVGVTPRYVAVAAMALARRREIQHLTVSELGISPSEVPRPLHLQRLAIPRVRPKKLPGPATGQSVAERLLAVTSGVSAKEKATILEGASEKVAADVIDYLRERRLLHARKQ